MASKKLRYVPSYDFSDKGSSKYAQIVKKFSPVFEKAALGGLRSMSDKEREEFFFAVEETAKYIAGGTEYFLVHESFESKNPRDRVSTAIFGRLASRAERTPFPC